MSSRISTRRVELFSRQCLESMFVVKPEYSSGLRLIISFGRGGGGTRYRSLLKRYAANRNVAGSPSGAVIGILNSRNPSSRSMALGSTQSLTEMSTGSFLGVKGGRR
jgi:hypothetical protein